MTQKIIVVEVNAGRFLCQVAAAPASFEPPEHHSPGIERRPAKGGDTWKGNPGKPEELMVK